MGLTRSGTSGFLNKNLFPHFFQRLSLATLVGKVEVVAYLRQGTEEAAGAAAAAVAQGRWSGQGLG